MVVTEKMRLVTIGMMTGFFLALSGCGDALETASETKIVGGQIVAEGATGPERVSTVGLNGCTGTIIAEDLILTAAHCYFNAISGGYVVFGTSFSSSMRQVIRIAAAAVNRNYSGPGNDIAVLLLASPIPEGYQAVPLYPRGQPIFKGDRVRLAGYGSDNTPDSFGLLRSVDSYIQRRANDGSIYVENGRTAACSGDSGGPLYLLRDGQWYTVGVTSTAYMDTSKRCVGGNHYAPVQENYDLILEMAKSLTGRSDPLNPETKESEAPSVNESEQEALPSVPMAKELAFQFDTDSLTEGNTSFTLVVENTGSNASNCTFEMEITRRNLFFPTSYVVEATLRQSPAGGRHLLEFDDYMASFRLILGSVTSVSTPTFQCR